MSNDPKSNREQILADPGRIYLLPNLFTAGNLFFGFVAIIRCIQAKYGDLDAAGVQEHYREAVWCILAAFVCDALDGRVARLGGRESLFGKEFDSIADVVSFGVAPALMVFFLILSPTQGYLFFRNVGWLIGFVYLLCASVRLARFNVITHPLIQNEGESDCGDFIGLPVPAAAGLIAALTLVLVEHELTRLAVLLPVLMLLIAWLMISQVPYPSFKNIDWHTQARLKTFIIIFVTFVLTVYLLKSLSLFAFFLCYIFFGLGRSVIRRVKRPRVKHA